MSNLRPWQMPTTWVRLLALLVCLSGCGGSSGGGSSSGTGGSTGTPPQISDLTLSRTTAAWTEGEGSITIQAQINYSDPEADLQTIRVDISDGTSLAISVPSPLPGPLGSIFGDVSVSTAQVGVFEADVWAVDRQGNESNHLTASFTVEQTAWTSTTTDGAPTARWSHTAVWTGAEMLVWGGRADGADPLTDAGRFDPTSNTWTPISMVGAPAPRHLHSAVWTGTEFIVWGGTNSNDIDDIRSDGARYDPQTDTWLPLSTVNQPEPRAEHTAVWSGTEMIVWGGVRCFQCADAELNSGASYDPGTDTWTPISVTNAPQARTHHAAVWTGSQMVVWGGDSLSGPTTLFDTGGLYDPASDTWSSTSMDSAPPPTRCHLAAWIGSEMMVFGGQIDASIGCGITSLDTGYRYDPLDDTWTSTALAGLATTDSGPKAVWTGTELIAWLDGSGARYDPVVDFWRGMETQGAPSRRRFHSLVWTGAQLIVWGGTFASGTDSGAIYDPALDTTP